MPLIRKPDGGSTTPTESVDPRALLGAPSPDDRWAAARQLAGQVGHAPLLLDALAQEQDERVREAILTALAKDGGADAIAGIVALIRSPEAATRTAALDALSTVPAAITANIAALLDDKDRDVRILSCDLARRLPTSEATSFLMPLLERDDDVNVCAAAVEVLSEVGDARAPAALQACARRFPKDGFLAYAIEVAIRRIGGGSASPSPSP